ncbi:eukaryotic phosphomannomutase [Pseudovirgaria hyperparasitica]|uniref:Phosphomannomutase n=1 Tax=Pseudovirgaria hyperparasitica TaxID=470096 RepID=A0A6A6WB71_9PEZI|nr:eukaryotic phosphomannomutase [Pseudovirgaria hyperparasitica]KAF2759210.1 eukaryotic phosphomannomutase [Pseudovirgaria hyperparasitica]
MAQTPTAASSYPPEDEREIKNTIVLFDVDQTLTIPRGKATPPILALLSALRKKVPIGYIGGSNLPKQQDQLGDAAGTDVRNLFDYCFAENGLVAFHGPTSLGDASFIQSIGDAQYKLLVNWVLRYIADLDIPVKRGTFVEFRRGMINVSPIGRNASQEERVAFEQYDKVARVRQTMVDRMRAEFAHLGLTFSIGGQISFDVFPAGWDKTYVLRYLPEERWATVHFFGDKYVEGGNDYEMIVHPRVTPHRVDSPEHTMRDVIATFFPEGYVEEKA